LGRKTLTLQKWLVKWEEPCDEDGLWGQDAGKQCGRAQGMSRSCRTPFNLLNDWQFYLEDQTEGMVQSIQSLVSSIRADDGMPIIRNHINDIVAVVGKVVTSTETAMSQAGNSILRDRGESIIRKLSDCRTKLLEVNSQGVNIRDPALLKDFTNKLPPLAFEIARETKVIFSHARYLVHAGTDKACFRNWYERLMISTTKEGMLTRIISDNTSHRLLV
jgi:hypothetical protein